MSIVKIFFIFLYCESIISLNDLLCFSNDFRREQADFDEITLATDCRFSLSFLTEFVTLLFVKRFVCVLESGFNFSAGSGVKICTDSGVDIGTFFGVFFFGGTDIFFV